MLIFVLTMLSPVIQRSCVWVTLPPPSNSRVCARTGADEAAYERYMLYLGGLLRGDMGRSWRTGNLVLDDLRARLPMSLELGVVACCSRLLLAFLSGYGAERAKIPWSTMAARSRHLGVAMPLFWGGLVLVYVFYFKLGIAPPPTGRIDMLVSPPSRSPGHTSSIVCS